MKRISFLPASPALMALPALTALPALMALLAVILFVSPAGAIEFDVELSPGATFYHPILMDNFYKANTDMYLDMKMGNLKDNNYNIKKIGIGKRENHL